MKNLLNKVKSVFNKELVKHRDKLPVIIGLLLVTIFYLVIKNSNNVSKILIYKNNEGNRFKSSRIISSYQLDSLYKSKEKRLSKKVHGLFESQKDIKEALNQLKDQLKSVEKDKSDKVTLDVGKQDKKKATTKDNEDKGKKAQSVGKEAENNKSGSRSKVGILKSKVKKYILPSRRSTLRYSPKGPNIISFPVKSDEKKGKAHIVLPVGSYVRAKMLTGVNAPEGKTYPVLLQLDYAYIIPNNKKLNLFGCFIIAKAQGNISTERVNMQADKLSCVSNDGEMFERKINGYVADSKDNNFAVEGEVKSKQERVAAIAFLSSIIGGISKAVQFAETGSQDKDSKGAVVTGNKMKYLAAGGASNAANMVTNWYLKQANNLLPTIKVGSGKDVWIVMQNSVKLPRNYFNQQKSRRSHENLFKYFNNFVH